MRNSHRLAALAMFFVLASSAYAATESPIRRAFNVTAPGRVVVKSDLGSINVRTVPENRVTVTVNRTASTSVREDAEDVFKHFKVEMKQNGNLVEITGTRDTFDFTSWLFGVRLRVAYDIAVPANFSVDLATAGGDVQVADLGGNVLVSTAGGDLRIGNTAGNVEARTAGGDVTIRGVRGHTVARTSGGDINVTEASGPLEIRTSGGDIKVGRAASGLVAHTSGGDVEIGAVRGALNASTSGGWVKAKLESQPTADSRVSSSGGNIDVTVPAAARLNLDASTSGGRVSTDLSMAVEFMKRSSLRGKANGGGPALLLRTSGGDITVKKF